MGYPCAPPRLLEWIAPDLKDVAKPHPQGAAILEIGIGKRGEVVSACVLRGVRADFDCAAQEAARHWRYSVPTLWGEPIGLVSAVVVAAPSRDPGGHIHAVQPSRRRTFSHPACR